MPRNDDSDGSTGFSMHSAFGHSAGVEAVDLERMEKWLFYGFLFCHHVVDVARKESGEYKVWSMLMQGMWVPPIFRYNVI